MSGLLLEEAEEFELDETDREDDGHENDAVGRRHAKVSLLEASAVEQTDHGQSDIAWRVARPEDVAFVEHGETAEDTNGSHENDGGFQHRQRDAEEPLNGAGTVDLRGLVQFLGYGLQSRQKIDD